jgi:hypothetical protein
MNHGEKEYVRGDVTANTVEGYYSIFKRGMKDKISALRRTPFAWLSRRIRFPVFQTLIVA